MSSDQNIKWRCSDNFKLFQRSWDNETVVYHSGSGDIHIFNSIAADALDVLTKHPCTLPRLAQQLADSQGIALDEKWLGHVTRLVDTFDQVGLIEPSES